MPATQAKLTAALGTGEAPAGIPVPLMGTGRSVRAMPVSRMW